MRRGKEEGKKADPRRTSTRMETEGPGSGVKHALLAAIIEDEDMSASYTTGDELDMKYMKKAVTEVAKRFEIGTKKAVKAISKAQKISLCFVVDTTGSMGYCITAVKSQISQIVEEVGGANCKFAGLSFVGYKDWFDGENHFEVLPFTKDVKKFKEFVGMIKTPNGSGGDWPEDVLGGLQTALDLEWPAEGGTRMVYHLADAPPHGNPLYHDQPDQYAGGHHADPSLGDLFRRMGPNDKDILYFFGHCDKRRQACKKMIQVFQKHYHDEIKEYHNHEGTGISRSVVEAVSTSVSLKSSQVGSHSGGVSMERQYEINKDPVNWEHADVLKAEIMELTTPASVKSIQEYVKLEPTVNNTTLQVAPHPFAKGSVRLAYYGRQYFGSSESLGSAADPTVSNVVLKEFINVCYRMDMDRSRYQADLETQVVAQYFANAFNLAIRKTEVNCEWSIKFLVEKVACMTDKRGKKRYMFVEKEFSKETCSEMSKYTNNYNFVRPGADALEKMLVELCVAFSHFSYVHSGKHLMVCDLQGSMTRDRNGKKTLLLTDPAINSVDKPRFGKTNMGERGFEAFFKRHKPENNPFCQALKL
jgi:hypothetical protein